MGAVEHDQMEIEADVPNLDTVIGFIEKSIKGLKLTEEELSLISIIVEELFVNIASYAYQSGRGMALISTNVDREENSIEVTFIDRGIQFNPIESKDTDINAPLFQRKKGGLGIFYVKKKVDDISYYCKDDENVLKIKKIFRG